MRAKQEELNDLFDQVHPEIVDFWMELAENDETNFLFSQFDFWVKRTIGMNFADHLVRFCARPKGSMIFFMPPDDKTELTEEEMLRRLKLRSFE